MDSADLLAAMPNLSPRTIFFLSQLADQNNKSLVEFIGTFLEVECGRYFRGDFIAAHELTIEKEESIIAKKRSIVRLENGKRFDANGIRLCGETDCPEKHLARNLCRNHRAKAERTYVAVLPVLSNIDGTRIDGAGVSICLDCDRKAVAKNRCAAHNTNPKVS